MKKITVNILKLIVLITMVSIINNAPSVFASDLTITVDPDSYKYISYRYPKEGLEKYKSPEETVYYAEYYDSQGNRVKSEKTRDADKYIIYTYYPETDKTVFNMYQPVSQKDYDAYCEKYGYRPLYDRDHPSIPWYFADELKIEGSFKTDYNAKKPWHFTDELWEEYQIYLKGEKKPRLYDIEKPIWYGGSQEDWDGVQDRLSISELEDFMYMQEIFYLQKKATEPSEEQKKRQEEQKERDRMLFALEYMRDHAKNSPYEGEKMKLTMSGYKMFFLWDKPLKKYVEVSETEHSKGTINSKNSVKSSSDKGKATPTPTPKPTPKPTKSPTPKPNKAPDSTVIPTATPVPTIVPTQEPSPTDISLEVVEEIEINEIIVDSEEQGNSEEIETSELVVSNLGESETVLSEKEISEEVISETEDSEAEESKEENNIDMRTLESITLDANILEISISDSKNEDEPQKKLNMQVAIPVGVAVAVVIGGIGVVIYKKKSSK